MSWTIVDQAIVSASNFLTIYLLARSLEAGEFGFYMLGWITLLFLVSLQSALISDPHNVLGARCDAEGYQRLTTVLAAALLPLAAALAGVLVLAGLLIWSLSGASYGQLLVMLGVVVAPWMAQEFVRRVHYTRSDARAASINDAVSYGLQALGIVVLVVWRRPSAPAAFGVLAGSSLLACILGGWQLRKYLSLAGITTRTARATLKECAGFGKWLLARNLVAWFGQHGHSWLLLAMLGPVALGTFKAAEHLLNLLNPLRLAAFAYLPPRGSRVYASGGVPALGEWLKGVYRSVVAGVAGGVLLLLIFSEQLLELAYGDKFAGLSLAWIIVFGGVAALTTFARMPLEMALMAMGESRPLFWVHVWSVPLLFTVGIALVHFWGIFGAPVAGIVIGTVLLGLTFRAFRTVSVRLEADTGMAIARVSCAPEPHRTPRRALPGAVAAETGFVSVVDAN